jgi:hypothetical protein
VTDSSGNTATATQTVTVTDDTDPTITAPSAVTVTTNDGCTATEVTLGDSTTSDNCSVASTTNDAPDAFDLGETTVTWTVTDGSGNTATATQTVTVTDDTDPTITVPSDISICNSQDVDLGTPETGDNCGVASITNDASDSFSIGETTVTWTVTDGVGNTATDFQIITIVDDIPPIITETSGNFAVSCQVNNVITGTPQVTDNCGVLSLSNNAPDEYVVGENIITWIATDVNGNIAEYLQIITLLNLQVPTAVCNDITLTLENGTAFISALDIGNESFDECEDDVELSISQNEFNESHIGENTVVLTVVDSGGNTSSCEATVTVVGPGLSIEENMFDSIIIYPNPTSEMIYIKSNVSSNYHLYNMIGQKIISGQINEGDNELNLRQYSNGIYFIKFIKNNRVYTKKIVKN